MSKIAKSAIGLMIATLIVKVLGFGRELVLGSAYGISDYTDAYVIASNIPIIIFAVIGSALSTTFIPMYHDVENELGKKESLKFTNNVFNIVVIACIIFAIIGFIFTEPVVKIFAAGFKGEKLALAVQFTKVMIIGIVFLGLSYLMTAYLQIKGNFIVPGLISLPQNIIIIGSIILSKKMGIQVLAYGSLLATASIFLFQLPLANKLGYKFKPYINLKDKNLKRMVMLLGPVLLGIAVGQVNTIIDRNLASTLVEGSISALNYANKLNGFVMGMFIVSISAVVYPELSKLSAEDNKEKFNSTVVRSVNSIILLVIPVSVGAIVLAEPIVKILFQRGAFDAEATAMTASALAAYSLGIVGLGVYDILVKAFFALQDTKTPLWIGTFLGVALNVIFNLVFIKFMGHTGLALGTSLATLIYTFVGFIALKRKIGNFGQEKVISATIKSIFASVVMGLVSIQVYKLSISIIGMSTLAGIVSLGISVLSGFIVYVILILVLKVDEVQYIIDTIKKRRLK